MLMFKKIIEYLRKKLLKNYLDIKTIFGNNYTILELGNGAKLRFRNVDQIGRALYFNRNFENNIVTHIVNNIHENDVVIDIGANIGYYTIQFAKKTSSKGKVLAIEPNPTMYKELLYNIKLNNYNNILLDDSALNDQKGSADFYIPRIGKEGHASLFPNVSFEVSEKIKVNLDTLDDILDKYQINKVDLIKIDVEGAELSIFKGAKKLLSSKFKPKIYFECSEITCEAFGHNVIDVLKFLDDLDYLIKQIDYGYYFARPKSKV